MGKKVMLVDDEEIIRTGITKLVPWQENGLSLAYAASNGQEALDYLRHHPIDIVITDIKMPVLDGMQLIQQATALGIKPHFIILTGFGEFEYARTAMGYGVQHYLLKPCNEQDIIKACLKVTGQDTQPQPYHKDSTIARIMEAIANNMDNPDLSLKWIARNILFMNENYLSKLFQKSTGLKFSQYLTKEKISHAKTLMTQNPNIKMIDICQQLGFANNPTYFSTLFKTKTGKTITEYRNNPHTPSPHEPI